MKSVEELVEYARAHAALLEANMHYEQGSQGFRGFWKADNPAQYGLIVSRAIAGLEFLRQYSGSRSEWSQRASAVYEGRGGSKSVESGARGVGDCLRTWANQVEAGIIEVAGARAQAEIDIVNTDVMGQVRRLIDDRQMHPAAPIVLCGAALETALRATVEAHELSLTERPSMSAYARLLRTAGLITVQDVKDIEQCGGLRNSAAHGEFDILSAERAGLMEQQTNLLLRRLGDLAP